uniref:U1-C C2H2-type zinc finger domain-containing protein n=1 Tax=Theropithecus gelada TaxID=9565 RepID=A0A8D2FWT9_THEGE
FLILSNNEKDSYCQRFLFLSNMPMYACDYCNKYLTHDSSSVKKIFYSGIYKENMKDCCQNGVEEQAQISSYSILCPSPAGAMIPPSPKSPCSSLTWYDASISYKGPSRDVNDGFSSSWDDDSGTCSWNEAAMGGHMPMMPRPPVMEPPTCSMMMPAEPRMTHYPDEVNPTAKPTVPSDICGQGSGDMCQ